MLFLFAALTSALAFGWNNLALADEPAAPSSEPAAAAHDESADAPAQSPEKTGGEKWRFRQHQGLWWYWLPSEKWVYWHGGKWVPYDPATYAELRQSMPVRSYSYYRGRNNSGSNGYPELGQWGPVRYNGYGQRQYPYSMRRSGIRQLGPVPAMGGVRSLPGWGGER
jgi:hypothetical protein